MDTQDSNPASKTQAARADAAVDQQLATIKAAMPKTYAHIRQRSAPDDLGTQAFALVRRGLRGEANCFWAMEGGHVVGTPFAADHPITADVAQLMVAFGCAYVCILPDAPKAAAPTNPAHPIPAAPAARQEAAHGSH